MALSIPFTTFFTKITKNIFLKLIDNDTHCMIYYHQMGDDIRAKLAELQDKGWTLANIARKIGQAKRTVESWNQSKRSPGNLQSVLALLDKLSKQKRIPKKKIYLKNSRAEGRHE